MRRILTFSALACLLLAGLGPSSEASFTAQTGSSAVIATATLDAWQPGGVSALRSGATCTVTWTANPAAPAGVSYDVVAGTATVTTAPNATSAVISAGPAPFTPTVTVRKNGWIGATPVSSASACAGLPGAPTVSTTTPTSSAITATWAIPTTNGGTLTSYTASTSPASTVCTVPAGSPRTCAFTGLSPGTVYTISVTATSNAGTGPAGTATAVPYPAVLDSANVALWLDAQSSSTLISDNDCGGGTATSGSSVGCWKDRSTFTRNASAEGSTPTLDSAAINGHPAVRFGVDGPLYDHFSVTGAGIGAVASGDRTLFAVAKPDGVLGTPDNLWAGIAMWPGYHSGFEFAWSSPEDPHIQMKGYQGGTPFGAKASLTPGVATLLTGSMFSESTLLTSTMSISGGQPARSTSTGAWRSFGDLLRLGALMDTAGQYADPLNGAIGEVIVISRRLTATEQRAVEAYLTARWGTALAPAAPTGVSATPAQASASVSWTAPSDAGTAPITGYTATASPGGSSCTTTGATTCVITGLTNGQVYDIAVQATSSVGAGPASSAVSLTPVLSGALFFAGADDVGQAGDGDESAQYTPVTTYPASVTSWRSIDAGLSSSCALRTDDSLWCWGYNPTGKLGVGDTNDRSIPTQVGDATDVASFGVGYDHTCAIKINGTLWCWGSNTSNQLGTGRPSTDYPEQVGIASNWAQVSGGRIHTCAIRNNGTLWCWGSGASGQLGNGTTSSATPIQVGSASNWARVATGFDYTCATRTDGTLWCFGLNDMGQLGLGDQTNRTAATQVGSLTTWASVTTGASGKQTCGLRTDNTLWCWGDNSNGQLGVGDTTRRTTPTAVSGTWSAADTGYRNTCATAAATGDLWCWGWNNWGQAATGDALDKWVPTPVSPGLTIGTPRDGKIAVGQVHTCAIAADGTTRCWGVGLAGQLGNSPPDSVLQQVTSTATWSTVTGGGKHACATRASGTLWCWGENTTYDLGLGDTTVRHVPVQVSGTGWAAASARSGGTCAVRTDATLWCWGSNGSGQLGLGDTTNRTTPSQLSGTRRWSLVSAGLKHTCAITTTGALWCWGANGVGQLGVGNTTSSTSPIQVDNQTWASVSVGNDFTCAIRDDNTLWCWGLGTSGQLGIGSTANQTLPTQVSGSWTRIAAGETHACARATTGAWWCWGTNASGELGRGNTTASTSPVQAGSATNWRLLIAGNQQSCALSTAGSASCTGLNTSGQLGVGDFSNRSTPTPVTTSNVWLDGDSGQATLYLIGS